MGYQRLTSSIGISSLCASPFAPWSHFSIISFIQIMYLFLDDELCSDSFPMKLVDNLIYEFKGRQVVRKEGDVVLAGSNPSAEGGHFELYNLLI